MFISMEIGFFVLNETILFYTYGNEPTTNNSSPWMFYVPTPRRRRSLSRPRRMPSLSTYRYELPSIFNAITQPTTVDEQQNLLHSQSLNGRVSSGLSQECISDYLLRSSGHQPTKENLICSICQGEIQAEEEISTLSCNHIYHSGCIGQWLMIKNECPVCRASVIHKEDI